MTVEAVDRARGELLEALRMLGVYTVNMLEYARWNFRACRPENVKRARLRILQARGRSEPA